MSGHREAPRLAPADDLLVHQTASPFSQVVASGPTWFDRFYFNVYAPSGGPLLVVGGANYANAGVRDGYACLVADGEQRNRRFSGRAAAGDLGTAVGPLRWTVVEALRSWRLTLDSDEQGFGCDVTWTARTEPYAVEPITVAHADGDDTAFSHYFQPGRYTGKLWIDGAPLDVDGWFGMRDRSWGVRRTRERLGMHLWGGAQLDDRCIAVLYNEDRDGRQVHLEGAVLYDDGRAPDAVVAVEHDLRFDDGAGFDGGLVGLTLGSGAHIVVDWDPCAPGLLMDGAGYGGWHGVDRGNDHREHERWALDGTRTPRSLPIALVNTVARCRVGDDVGIGVFETALSRSSSYTYRPNRRA